MPARLNTVRHDAVRHTVSMKILRHLGADSEGFSRIFRAEHAKSTERTENREKRFKARSDIELSRFSPCPSAYLCDLCVEFRDREYSEK